MKIPKALSLYIISLCCLCAVVSVPGPAQAHSLGQCTVDLSLKDGALQGNFIIYLDDLPYLVPELPYKAGELTLKNVGQYEPQIRTFVAENILLSLDGKGFSYQLDNFQPMNVDGQRHVEISLAPAPLERRPGSVEIELLPAFFRANPQYISIVTLKAGDMTRVMVLTDEDPKAELFIDRVTEFVAFLRYGTKHIGLGSDHVAFLVLLIFSAFLLPVKENKGTPQFKAALWTMVKLATAFTVAHSLTLALAVLDIYTLPSSIVEIIIAASIVFVGLHNLFHFDIKNEWPIVFCFGLFHGYGFSSVLKEIGLSSENLVLPLVGFNLGVEAGQVLIILACLIPLYVLSKRWPQPALRLMRAACIVITIIAVFWVIERILRIV